MSGFFDMKIHTHNWPEELKHCCFIGMMISEMLRQLSLANAADFRFNQSCR